MIRAEWDHNRKENLKEEDLMQKHKLRGKKGWRTCFIKFMTGEKITVNPKLVEVVEEKNGAEREKFMQGARHGNGSR